MRVTITFVGLAVVALAAFILWPEPAPEPSVLFERDESTLRALPQGDIVGGIENDQILSWRGIPFAEPPVGDLRWRAPQPVMPSEGTFEATTISDVCPQFAGTLSSTGNGYQPGEVAGSEDCLYLNIWSPKNAQNLPVMFWIHGGGNTAGSGGAYRGTKLAQSQNVVVISINYRLGFLGWFSHPALKNGDPLDDSGNYGLLDIIAALKWTQENVEQFGGNPNNVTIFGESAGAFNVLAMMASPLATDLFHRAVSQSGGLNPQTMTEAEKFEKDGGHPGSSAEITNQLLILDGQASDPSTASEQQTSMGPTELSDYLQAKNTQELFSVFSRDGTNSVRVPDLLLDGHVLPKLSTKDMFSNADNHNMVPIILGTNRDEGALWMVRNPEYIENKFGFWPTIKDESAYRRYVHYGAKAWKLRGVDNLARYMTSAGNDSVFAYRFDWDEEPSQYGFDLGFALGAAHGLEIPFVFGDFTLPMLPSYLFPGDKQQLDLANSMMSYWSEFAYHGNPGKGRSGNETSWQRWGDEGQYSLLLDTSADQGIRMNDEAVTLASLKQELKDDTGFEDPIAHCRTYVRNFRNETFNQSEYEALNSECAKHEPESLNQG